jgi:hypothetical protein
MREIFASSAMSADFFSNDGAPTTKDSPTHNCHAPTPSIHSMYFLHGLVATMFPLTVVWLSGTQVSQYQRFCLL